MRAFLIAMSILWLCTSTMAQGRTGCVTGTCIQGKGTYHYANGNKYSGDWIQSLPHGKGTYSYRDGNIYSGDWIKGQRQGSGKMIYKNGDVYIGQWSRDIIVGKGKMTYKSGDVYIGEWFDGRSHGRGTYTFADGDSYVGEFYAGAFNGKGKLTRRDGSSYEGTWANNKKHGNGILTDVSGKVTTQSYDQNKLITEAQAHTSTTTGKQEVNKNEVRDCTDEYCDQMIGKYVYGDGSVFVGDFVQGQATGQGTCYYVNGDRYEGGWRSHGPHGEGVMYFGNGNVYAARWELGVPVEKRLAPPPSKAKTNPATPTKKKDPGSMEIYSLIVGIASYNHMQSLKYTDDDAYQLYAFLKSPEGGAIPDNHIKILIDDAATKGAITKEVQNIASLADENDVIILYMSGHGLDGHFVPSDFNGYQNHLAYGEVLELLNNSAAKHKMFIADACHSGSMLASAKSPYSVSLQNFYDAYNTSEGGTAVVMSSKKEEVSLEYGGLRQGVFSHFLIKGLKGNADSNKNKIITITELYAYISEQVKAYTSKAQNPQIMGDYDAEMPVAMIR
jgi:hypothetical protein